MQQTQRMEEVVGFTTGPDPMLESISKLLPIALHLAGVPEEDCATVKKVSHLLTLIAKRLPEMLCDSVVWPNGKPVLQCASLSARAPQAQLAKAAGAPPGPLCGGLTDAGGGPSQAQIMAWTTMLVNGSLNQDQFNALIAGRSLEPQARGGPGCSASQPGGGGGL